MIFTITGIHTLDKSWDSRCFGFYYTFHYAELSVINNNADIAEKYYNYMIIEAIEEGVYPDVKEKYIYKYNNEQNIFERIDWPKELIHFTNFGIG